MRWLLVAAGLVAFVAAHVVGGRLGRRGRATATWTVGVCLGLLLLRGLFRFRPEIEAAIVGDSDLYAVLRPWWALPFAVALLAAGAPHAGSARAGSLLRVFAAVVAAASSYQLLGTALLDPRELEGRLNGDGVCIQTTPYTCGAAAAATLLHTLRLESDEAEMAELCWTNKVTGTDELCVLRGLRRRLAEAGSDLRPKLRRIDVDELTEFGRPAMAVVKWGAFVDHWVVVLEATPDEVRVADPAKGLVTSTPAEFEARWRGLVITLQ
jgi:hypothetical protein